MSNRAAREGPVWRKRANKASLLQRKGKESRVQRTVKRSVRRKTPALAFVESQKSLSKLAAGAARAAGVWPRQPQLRGVSKCIVRAHRCRHTLHMRRTPDKSGVERRCNSRATRGHSHSALTAAMVQPLHRRSGGLLARQPRTHASRRRSSSSSTSSGEAPAVQTPRQARQAAHLANDGPHGWLEAACSSFVPPAGARSNPCRVTFLCRPRFV